MLRAEHVTKRYPVPGKRGAWMDAVSDVSIALSEGSVTSIVGESGSGKSTLARLLAYVERPDQGRILLNDLDVTKSRKETIRAVRGQVQLVMQDALSSLDAHQSAKAILEEPLRLLFHLSREEREKRCRELLEMVQLGQEVLYRRPDELSGGQQKRLCIARALAAQPRHILFDESFSGLDVTLRKQMLEFLRELQKELRISFLMITHDLDIAMYMGGSVHVMRGGKIIETVENPRHFGDFHQPYSKELVQAALYKRAALQ